MSRKKVQQVLTSDFFSELANCYGSTDLGSFIENSKNILTILVELNYDDLYAWDMFDEKTARESAFIVYHAIGGDAMEHIFSALKASYNPLENFFTDGERTEEGSGTDVKTGTVHDKPDGKITTQPSGERSRSYDEDASENQGTTFEDTSNYKNISKTTHTGGYTDSFNGYKEEVDYTDYDATRTYNTTNTLGSEKTITENRSGNSGIFSKQDLTQREINLRLRNSFAPILVRRCVDAINIGVWGL